MQPDAAHDKPNPPLAGGADEPPRLPYARAFIVQFGAETDTRLGNVMGRIEHLQTGRRSRFASVDELIAWIMAMLARADLSQDG